MKRVHCEVYGKVQSTGFRDFCWRCSRKTGVSGWVSNDLSDHHHVVLEVQGEEAQMEKFFSLLQKGDGRCQVDSIVKSEIPADPDEKEFQARHRF
jgi:acylphosphatase